MPRRGTGRPESAPEGKGSLSASAFPGGILQRPSLQAARLRKSSVKTKGGARGPCRPHRRSGTGPSALPRRVSPEVELGWLGAGFILTRCEAEHCLLPANGRPPRPQQSLLPTMTDADEYGAQRTDLTTQERGQRDHGPIAEGKAGGPAQGRMSGCQASGEWGAMDDG